MTKHFTQNQIYIFLLAVHIFAACNSQVKPNLQTENTIPSKPSPVVIRTPSPPGFHFDGVEDTTLVSQYFRSIYQDTKGNYWFGTAFEGVCKYDGDTLTYYTKLDVFGANSVFAIAEDKSGNIWFGTDEGVFKYDGKHFTNYKEKAGLSNIQVSRKSILVDKSDNIWVGTEAGIFKYNPLADTAEGKCFSLFPLLGAIKVRGIMQDKEGNIWFASQGKGVYCYDPLAALKAGAKTITNFSEPAGLGENYAGGMIQDKMGNFWFTMFGGICRYNPSAADITDRKAFTYFTNNDGLGGTEIWGIYQEKSGIIWITARGSTTRYDGKTFEIFTQQDGLNCFVQSMYQDREGNMWWGAGSGLFRFDGKRFYQVKQKGPW